MVTAPGRVNLIGEHIDYHGLAVLPMALRRSIRIQFQARGDGRICVTSGAYGYREFAWTPGLTPVARGDWENYLRAAAQAIAGKWGVMNGMDATIDSDLPAAVGLSSSSALIVAVTLALLRANRREATFEELMEILPDGEQFVGTRGGGMDHAASLASREGCASLIEFAPLGVHHIPIPEGWAFLVANSLQTAEKSGAVRERYNAVRAAGTRALGEAGFRSYAEAMRGRGEEEFAALAAAKHLPPEFLHVVTEALRVRRAVEAMEQDDAARFGRLLLASHASLRDRLEVSCPALDRLVEAAMDSGALGARLTGAGFGGCAVVLCRRGDAGKVRDGMVERFYFGDSAHILHAEAGRGAVNS
jgi:galactokinase